MLKVWGSNMYPTTTAEYIVTCTYVYYRRGFGLEIAFIDYFNTQFVTKKNNAVADLNILQITRARALLNLLSLVVS
jgi:hypothetical protein